MTTEEVAGLGHLLVFAFLFCFSAFMVAPVMTDVTMAALCPGRDECSLAIYLTGLQQAGFLGLSGAILVQIYRTLYIDPSSFILMLAVLPTAVTLVLMYFVDVHNPNERYNKKFLDAFSLIAVTVAGYLMILIICGQIFSISSAVQSICFVVLLILVMSPIAVALKAQTPHEESISEQRTGLLREEVAEDSDNATSSTALGGSDQDLSAGKENLNVLQAMCKLNFWLLFLAMACGMGSGLATVNNISQIGGSLGYTTKETSTLVSLWSIWNFSGRFGAGFISGHFLRQRGIGRPFFIGVTGLGALVLTPVVGNLSDRYGRKALLALPATASIVPLGILAYGRTKGYFYAYYITKTLTAMVSEGTMMCLSLAYVADRVPETRRAAAFGVFSGVCSAGFVASTVAARFLPASSTFQVSAAAAVVTAVYMKAFLQETDGGASVSFSCGSSGSDEEASRPLCLPSSSTSSEEASPRLPPLRKAPSLSELAAILTTSSTFSRAAVVTFFQSLGEAGLLSTLLYFLKAKFHYSKNQYANLLLIIGITGSFSQLTVMPLLVPKLGEQKLLVIALIASCGQAFLYSIAWSFWVPYLAASSVILSMLVTPCIRSIVSKKAGPFEQGMVQGCITGISSTASVISPLIFTPLTAWCLSEATPYYFKGFSLACAGFATLVAFATSISMRPAEVQPDRK